MTNQHHIAMIDVEDLALAALKCFSTIQTACIIHELKLDSKTDDRFVDNMLQSLKAPGPHPLKVRQALMQEVADHVVSLIEASMQNTNTKNYRQACANVFRDLLKKDFISQSYQRKLAYFDDVLAKAMHTPTPQAPKLK